MQMPIQTPGVDAEQLGQLLSRDRNSAGESRRSGERLPLRTAVYKVPWRILIKRGLRESPRARLALVGAGLVLAASLAFPLFSSVKGVADRASSADVVAALVPTEPQVAARLSPEPEHEPGNGHESSALRPAAVAGAVRLEEQAADAAPRPEQEALSSGQEAPSLKRQLPVQLRLQRGDVWLSVGTVRAASVARRFIESALSERPKSAHGQAALARACLRLNDEDCARAAIERAREIRPKRRGYRRLERQIQVVFGSR